MMMVMAVKMIIGGVHGEMEEMIESYVEISVVSRFPLLCPSLSYWYVGTHGPLLVHIEACLGWGGCGIYGYIHNICIAYLTSLTYIPFYFWGQQHRQTVEMTNSKHSITPIIPNNGPSSAFMCSLTRVITRRRNPITDLHWSASV